MIDKIDKPLTQMNKREKKKKMQIVNAWSGLSLQILQTLKTYYRNVCELQYANKFDYLDKTDKSFAKHNFPN